MVGISKRLTSLAAAGLLAGGLGIAAVSGAFAASPSPTASPAAATAGQHSRGPRGKFGGGFFGPVATFLGISTSTLQTDLQNGQTLAQIAQANGKSVSDLVSNLTSKLKTQLDQRVAAGKMTSAQETTALANATTRFNNMVNQTFNRGQGKGQSGANGARFGQGFLNPIATYLGVSLSDLQTALKGGQTLTQIAQAHGHTAADLKTLLLNNQKTQLDKVVAAGKMTSAQETTRLNQAGTRIDHLLTQNFQNLPARTRGRRPAGTPAATPSATATPGS